MTRFKICGLTQAQDVHRAIEVGAHAIGFVHIPGSRRYVSAVQLRTLTHEASPLITRVVVISDLPLEEVQKLADKAEIDAFQLHGQESVAYVQALRQILPSHFAIFKAIRVRRPSDLAIASSFQGWTQALVLDSGGGTGHPFDWNLLTGWVSSLPIILAGGLTPENVAGAIAQVRPYAVDVSSGVEKSPGLKDPELLASFASAVERAH